jgi:hypothetical protein
MLLWLRMQGFESLINKDFVKENGILIQMKNLKTIESSI